MKFGETKYINNPLMTNGRIALIDLDKFGAVQGLTSGGGNQNHNGIFGIIPSDWFDEFIPLANEHLSEEEFIFLETRLEYLKQKAINREQKLTIRLDFYKNQQITFPQQKISFDLSKIESLENNPAAKKARKILTQLVPISNSKILSLYVPRKAFWDFKFSMNYFNENKAALEILLKNEWIQSYKYSKFGGKVILYL